jgi:hypothetical protein
VLKIVLATVASLVAATWVVSASAEARSCIELRALCWTMRDDKSDCAAPFRRCPSTGVFITPLGRRFVATSRR